MKTKWITETKYVDLETGEWITKAEAQKNYEISKPIKDVTTIKEIAWTKAVGRTERTVYTVWIYECRRKQYTQATISEGW